MTSVHEHPTLEKILRGLATILRFVEEVNTILSSVLISFSVVLAVMSLVTDNRLLEAVPGLLWFWAASLAIGVEASLVSAWDRAHGAFIERRRWTAVAWCGLGILLASIAFIAVTSFTLSQSLQVGESQALAMLGFSTVGFDVGRSGVTILLAVIAGITRPRKVQMTQADKVRELKDALELEPLQAQLDAMRVRNKAKVKAAQAPTPPQYPTGGSPVAVPAAASNSGSASRPQIFTLAAPNGEARKRVARAKLSLRDKIWKALDADTSLSKSDLAKRYRCSESRASELKREWAEARAQATPYAQ